MRAHFDCCRTTSGNRTSVRRNRDGGVRSQLGNRARGLGPYQAWYLAPRSWTEWRNRSATSTSPLWISPTCSASLDRRGPGVRHRVPPTTVSRLRLVMPWSINPQCPSQVRDRRRDRGRRDDRYRNGRSDSRVFSKLHGPGRWRKRKGLALVRLWNGRLRRVELHWYEAHGIGRRDFKIKRYVDEP